MDMLVPLAALAGIMGLAGWLWGWTCAWSCIGREDRKAIGRNGVGICNTRGTAAGENVSPHPTASAS